MATACPPVFVQLAERLADASGAVIRRYFRTPVAAEAKADATPVTVADRAAEAAMRDLIAETFPEHGIVGEEHGSERSDAEFVWVLDPIDGTKSFITGRPIFGTLIALTHGGAPILGVIDQPVLGERWIGAVGAPTTFNGAAAAVRTCPMLDQAMLSSTSPDLFVGGDRGRFGRLADKVRHALYGGDCYAYALLASGFVDLVVEAGLNSYDFCALVPVVEGAGGLITDWRGERLSLASGGWVVAAGDPRIHDHAIRVLSES